MIWTLFSLLAVVATKLVTSLRLKDMKARLEKIQPRIDELRTELLEAEEEHETLKLKEEAIKTRLTHLKDVVNNLERDLKAPNIEFAEERLHVIQAASSESEAG